MRGQWRSIARVQDEQPLATAPRPHGEVEVRTTALDCHDLSDPPPRSQLHAQHAIPHARPRLGARHH